MSSHLDRTESDELWPLKEAAQFLAVSESFARRHSVGKQEPHIPCVKIGGRIKFRVNDLKAFVASQNEE